MAIHPNRRRTAVFLALVLTLFLCACDRPSLLSPQSPDGLRLVVDMAGREVRLPAPEKIRRIGCLEVLCYEKLFLLGASDRVVMMTRTNAPWMRRTNPAIHRIQQLLPDPPVEELLRQEVDVVFRTHGYPNPAKMEQLAQTGIPVLVSQNRARLDGIDAFVDSRNRMLRLFAQALGPEYQARAEEWCAYHDRMVRMVRVRTVDIPAGQRVRLYHVRGPAAVHTQGKSSHTYWYGIIAGADMVVGKTALAGKGDLSLEEIIDWDPQVINIGRHYSADLVLKDPNWVQTSAVRDGRVHELPEGVFYWDGSTEGVLLMLYLARELYPERFPDLDVRKEIRDYYARFYRYTLSGIELDLMLAGKGPDGKRINEMNN
ncbi:MAG: ABC transporter substrate-binding protein [Azoarcus sp.]|jgi:iron complex transport system substrate-binding protein|nr:ABC transporter substrate-binding protein [Azoarcus sp.]